MAKKQSNNTQKEAASASGKKRAYLKQSDVPLASLASALRIPTAIVENYGGDPSAPVEVAEAIDVSPTSSTFQDLCGASIAFGLTVGGCKASEISLTPLAERICEPTEEGDDLIAKREAFLTPRIIREFLGKYDGKQLPKVEIASNVLKKMDVPANRVDAVHDLILTGATELGLLREIKGKRFVHLRGSVPQSVPKDEPSNQPEIEDEEESNDSFTPQASSNDLRSDIPSPPRQLPSANNRVFVTHGKNRALIGPIKRLLEFGQLLPVVSVEQQSISKPVPDKVMDDMRSCSAAIIHVDDELRLMDSEAKEHVVLNPNVLIEIGAAMGLYGRSFILLVKDGARLPSNLQGLFEVRYTGETLDGDATIRLMEAINELKKHSQQTNEG